MSDISVITPNRYKVHLRRPNQSDLRYIHENDIVGCVYVADLLHDKDARIQQCACGEMADWCNAFDQPSITQFQCQLEDCPVTKVPPRIRVFWNGTFTPLRSTYVRNEPFLSQTPIETTQIITLTRA